MGRHFGEDLRTAGANIILSERKNGTSTTGRAELAASLMDLEGIAGQLRDKSAHLKATEQPINTSTQSNA
jgi:hypothetical protein